MNDRNYAGPNAAGIPRWVIPDWLNHTANAIAADTAVRSNSAPQQDPGPNGYGAATNTTLGSPDVGDN